MVHFEPWQVPGTWCSSFNRFVAFISIDNHFTAFLLWLIWYWFKLLKSEASSLFASVKKNLENYAKKYQEVKLLHGSIFLSLPIVRVLLLKDGFGRKICVFLDYKGSSIINNNDCYLIFFPLILVHLCTEYARINGNNVTKWMHNTMGNITIKSNRIFMIHRYWFSEGFSSPPSLF